MSILRCLCAMLLWLPFFAQAEVFVFTAIPDQDESHLQQRFGKVADYLAKELAVEVQYIPVKSYAAAITAFRNNQVQLAWFGGLSGVQARRLVPGSEALAQGYEDQYFKSYKLIIPKRDDFLRQKSGESPPFLLLQALPSIE